MVTRLPTLFFGAVRKDVKPQFAASGSQNTATSRRNVLWSQWVTVAVPKLEIGTSLAVAWGQHSPFRTDHGHQVEGAAGVAACRHPHAHAGHGRVVARARGPPAAEPHRTARRVGPPDHPGPAAHGDDRRGDLRRGDDL